MDTYRPSTSPEKRTAVQGLCKATENRTAVQGLYKGNWAHVARLLPEVGLRFALNEQLRIMFSPLDGRPIGREGKLLAGATTGTLCFI